MNASTAPSCPSPNPRRSLIWQRLGFPLSLAIIAIAAIGLRLTFSTLTPPLLNPDSEGYVQAGWDLLHGRGLDLGLRRTPGYGAFIAATFALFGERLTSIIIAQHILGVINSLLAFGIARQVIGPTGAFVVGLLTAVSGPMLLYEHYVMTETLSATVLLVALTAYLQALRHQTLTWALATGILTGVALLCRPALQIILIVGALGFAGTLRSSPRRLGLVVGAMVVGASIFMLPWMVKNATMYGTFSLAGPGRHLLFRLIRSDDGFSFARPGSSTDPEPEPLASARRVLVDQAAKHDGSSNYKRFREELGFSEAETNRFQTALAIEAIRQQPGYFLAGTTGLFLQTLVGEPINVRREGQDLSEVDWDRSIRHLVNPPPPRGDRQTAQQLLSIWDPSRLGWLMPSLFALGLVWSAFVRRSAPVLMIGIIALAPQILGAAMAGFALRFRYPFDPLIAIVAWYGLSESIRALTARLRQDRAP